MAGFGCPPRRSRLANFDQYGFPFRMIDCVIEHLRYTEMPNIHDVFWQASKHL